MAILGTGTTIILFFVAVIVGYIFFKMKGNVSLSEIFK